MFTCLSSENKIYILGKMYLHALLSKASSLSHIFDAQINENINNYDFSNPEWTL